MTTQSRDHFVTRGDPWRPPPLTVFPSVAAFSGFWSTVRDRWGIVEIDDTDPHVVGQVTLAGGGIVILDGARIQLAFPASVTRLWQLGEYFYDVQGRLIADNQPYTLVRGRLVMGPAATQTP